MLHVVIVKEVDIVDALGQFRDRLGRAVLGCIVQQEVLLWVWGCVDLRPGVDGARIRLIVSVVIGADRQGDARGVVGRCGRRREGVGLAPPLRTSRSIPLRLRAP